jgi:hypothetical protein
MDQWVNESMDEYIRALDKQFANLHRQSCALIEQLKPEQLYLTPPALADSCGEQVLRSAAIVEQAFGGLTANLWDDPFEWTLPETLSTPAKLIEYLNEVEATRRQGFQLFKSDQDLSKEFMAPAGKTQLKSFLLDTLERARHHQQRAIAALDRLTQKSTDH